MTGYSHDDFADVARTFRRQLRRTNGGAAVAVHHHGHGRPGAIALGLGAAPPQQGGGIGQQGRHVGVVNAAHGPLLRRGQIGQRLAPQHRLGQCNGVVQVAGTAGLDERGHAGHGRCGFGWGGR